MKSILCIGLALALSVPTLSMAEASRQEVVAARGADVMPFSLKATTHVFAKTDQGGIQQVVAKDPKDAQQVRLTRQHLQEIADQFAKGDFSGPRSLSDFQYTKADCLKFKQFSRATRQKLPRKCREHISFCLVARRVGLSPTVS